MNKFLRENQCKRISNFKSEIYLQKYVICFAYHFCFSIKLKKYKKTVLIYKDIKLKSIIILSINAFEINNIF